MQRVGRVFYSIAPIASATDVSRRLRCLGVAMGLAQYGKAGVGMQVDEAGTDDVAGGVDDAGGVPTEVGVVAAVDRERIAGYGDGGVETGAAGAVDYLAVGDE